MEPMGTSNKTNDNNDTKIDTQIKKSNEMIETPTAEQKDSAVENAGIHPLTQELKDMTFLQDEAALLEETPIVNSSPKDPNIGAMLKRIREEKGHSLKVVSQQTKIHLALLEALEDNQLIRLPSKTYVKGFVKSYAKILNVPQNEAIELFENTYREYEGLPPVQANTTKEASTPNEPTKASKPHTSSEAISEIANVASHNGGLLLKVGLGIFVLAVIGINLKSMIERSIDEAPQELPEVISTTTKPKKVEAPTTPTTAETAKVPEVVAPATVNIITKETIRPDVKISDELTLKPFSAVEKQHKEITMAKEEMDEFLPARFRVSGGGLEYVFINATKGDSWLTYKTDENDIKKFVLRQGRTLFLKGKEIRLFIGNTNNVKVFYNNKPVELITTTGVKNAVFPESLKTKLMNPLFVFQKDGTVITSDEAIEKMKAETSAQAPATPVAPTTKQVQAPATPVR